MGISDRDLQAVIAAAQLVPRTDNSYLVDDFVSNLLLTVIDFQMHTTSVERAFKHYGDHLFDQVRTMGDLQALMDDYPEDKEGNTALAQKLWGYSMWTRAAMLRGLVDYFDRIGIRDQEALRDWAAQADFKRDFEGRVRGLGPAVFQWLIMRQGVETVKPDVHLRRFAERAVERTLSDQEVIDLVTQAAGALGMKAHELDWGIWEHERSASSREPAEADARSTRPSPRPVPPSPAILDMDDSYSDGPPPTSGEYVGGSPGVGIQDAAPRSAEPGATNRSLVHVHLLHRQHGPQTWIGE